MNADDKQTIQPNSLPGMSKFPSFLPDMNRNEMDVQLMSGNSSAAAVVAAALQNGDHVARGIGEKHHQNSLWTPSIQLVVDELEVQPNGHIAISHSSIELLPIASGHRHFQ